VVEPTIKAKTGTRQRVDLDPFAFDDLIETKGVGVKVYRTSYCPNTKSADGAEHNIDCALCNGSGWVDLRPICTKAFISSIALEKLAKMEGLLDNNSVVMTFKTGISLQYFTLIELEDFSDIYIQRFMRDPGGATDILKYRACRVNFVLDRGGTEYFQDSDFKIDNNGDITWLATPTAAKPADNEVVSIHYEARVQFRAIRASHVNRFSQYTNGNDTEFLKFPESWILQKEFLVRRQDEATGTDLRVALYDNHIIVP